MEIDMNIYANNDINILISSTPDIIKYYDIEKYINDNFDKYLYIPSNSKFNNSRYNKYIKKENDVNIFLDLQLLNEYSIKSQFLDYLNKKYNKNFTNIYIEPPFSSPVFNKKIDDLVDNYRWDIYNHLMTITFFIFIILHSLFINYNIEITYIYIFIIILSIILLILL